MTTNLCPTCGCSLIRLGIDFSKAPAVQYLKDEYYFCCDGCASVFNKSPEKYIKEIENIIVCPVCLAEKPKHQTVVLVHKTEEIFFCRCTHCMTEFSKNPDYYLDRLAGKIDYQGLFGNACCQN